MLPLARSRRIFRVIFGLAVVLVVTYIIYINPFNASSLEFSEIPFLDSLPSFDPVPDVPLEKHFYRPDGLLEVNSAGPHPIFELIKQAEEKWKKKLEGSSSTLEQAVLEYKRRYQRNPPKGFDAWWDYVQRHKILLPDEYDSIHNDLEPFWGIPPSELLRIRAELETQPGHDSYTLGKSSATDPVDILNTSLPEERYKDLIYGSTLILELLHEVDEFLPAFRAVFSPHDPPSRLSYYDIEKAARDAAMGRTYVDPAAFPKVSEYGWALACSPSSPLGQLHPIDLDTPLPKRPQKTFIHDHRAVMDPCNHPNLLWHHGGFLSHDSGPQPQKSMIPQFSYCSTTVHHDIRIPTPYEWIEDMSREDDPEWKRKTDKRLLWRGTNTGIYFGEDTRWRESHRVALVEQTNNFNGSVNLLPSPKNENFPLGAEINVHKAHLNTVMFDIAFAGEPTACTPPICDELKELFDWKERQSRKEAGIYKYVLDVDGNGWSGRFKRLITSNSVVFKSTIYPEWYMERIAPWLHYVPVQVDLSDLHDALVFFRGDINGKGAHEDLAKKIAKEGRQWSKTFWRREDLVAYFFRLILEYARVMSLDREAMTYQVVEGQETT
ncbi:glycosyl transferase family 90-domain-containing protein [Mycena floridula]|nr:glycosyl transferase family 90-domain-containing protein [Mycena floridula]